MKLAVAIMFLVAVSACSNKLTGNITVDGEAFALSECRSGKVYGFSGVELTSKQGARIRIAQTPSGEGVAFLMPAGADKGVELGLCGTFKVSTQNSTINDVKNVEGSAKLKCTAEGHSISGTVSFANCH